MSLYRALTVASLKMYFRNRQAIFWALFFPLLIMVIFGLMNFDRYEPPDIGFADEAGNEASSALLEGLSGAADQQIVKLTTGAAPELLAKLEKGDLDAVFVVPPGFGAPDRVSEVKVTYDVRRAEAGTVATTILNEALDRLFQGLAQVPAQYRIENRFRVAQTAVEGRSQGFQGFLVPGVAAMAIMQAGIFGVVFSLVRFRAQGVLRRLKATPINPAHFLVGQVITRLVIAVMQALILVIVGALMFSLSIGNGDPFAWVLLTLFAVLGGALFISIGLAISGTAKTEDTAAPISNIIAMPMMFLSGVFFPIDFLPRVVANVSQYLPLTYLADGMRAVAIEGAGIRDLTTPLAGLSVWIVITFWVATRTFKWE